MSGMKSQDLVILLKLASLQDGGEQWDIEHLRPEAKGDDPYSVRGLEAELGISKSEVNASIRRSLDSGLAVRDRRSGRPIPNRKSLYGFITHGLKFVFPARPGAMMRGLPTAFAAPMLAGDLISGGQYDYVWPAADGEVMGQSVEPLFKSVPHAALKDMRLYEYLALVDAVRLGNPRESSVASQKLSDRLLKK